MVEKKVDSDPITQEKIVHVFKISFRNIQHQMFGNKIEGKETMGHCVRAHWNGNPRRKEALI